MEKVNVEGKEAVIYTRFSPRPNADKCDSCTTQEQLCRRWCKKQGLPVAATFQDTAAGGGDEQRVGLWNAVGALNGRRILVVYKWDRLARNAYLLELIERAVRKKNAALVAIADAGNGSSADDKLIRGIIGNVVEWQRKTNAARIKAAMLNHQRNGRRMSHQPPYGWKCVGEKRIEPDEKEQEIIKLVFKLRREGLGYRRICNRLNKAGLRGRKGRLWKDMMVWRIIKKARRDGLF